MKETTMTDQEKEIMKQPYSISNWNWYRQIHQKLFPNDKIGTCSCQAKNTYDRIFYHLNPK
jgi:hypothetical protein